MILSKITNPILPDGREWYYEHPINGDTLTITVGDSWTWGDSLGKTTLEFDDREHRVTHIYGNLLSLKLNSDFINIGIPGGSNLYILSYLEKVLSALNKKYNKTYIIFTLTESGRELRNGFLQQRDHYNAWAGGDWPAFESIIDQTATLDQLNLVLNDIKGTQFLDVVGLYLALRSSSGLIDLLNRYEIYTVNRIRQQVPGAILARNFTTIMNKDLFDITKRWTDVIAANGCLPDYPDNIHVLSTIGLNPLLEMCKHLDQNQFKQEWLSVLDESNNGINWLLKSQYNSNKFTKHPLEKAHRWWAEHLYERITQ
jgi:hypothetical protein